MSLPSCSNFAKSAENLNWCKKLEEYTGMKINVCNKFASPEPRAASTDLWQASFYLEDAIILPFRIMYKIEEMSLTEAIKKIQNYIDMAIAKIYYAWMYLCISTGEGQPLYKNPHAKRVIDDTKNAQNVLNVILEKMSKEHFSTIEELNKYVATYIYGFQAVINALSHEIDNLFREHW